jgi:hypothetical protein
MSIRRSTARRTVVTTLATLSTGVFIASAGTASAIPFEGTPDPTRCERLLTRAVDWPGGDAENTRFVSDGYVSFLATRPDCADPRR